MIAARYQVLCVTHLPQIASFADRHLSVAKATENGRTATTIREVSGDERLQEIAQMIRGDAVTEQTLAEAADMVAAGGASSTSTSTSTSTSRRGR
jgi:DNA repair protein RecN (Recombination protein N)